MISLIICSKSLENLIEFKKFALNRLGVNNELIFVDNSNQNYSIAQAYNKGAFLSKFEILVFVHEDIFFHTLNWGQILVQWFLNLKNPGILGIAGSSYLPVSPSDWWLSDRKYLHMNFFSNDKNGKIGKGILKESGDQKAVNVFALDGMFLAMKKSVWEEFPFDESFEGFHGYDTSICYRVAQKYQNYFVPGILIEHFSKGYPNNIWLINTIKANQSIHNYIDHVKKGSEINKELEVKAYHLFLNQLKKFSNSYEYVVTQSWIYLLRNLKHYFHIRLILLWTRFQFVFIYKSLWK